MKVKRVFSSILVLLIGLMLLLPAASVSAHGSTTLGDYTIEIGFKNEPALQGMPNGLDLTVTNTKTNQPVTGLETTLKAELIFGASKETLSLDPVEGADGNYTAAVLPTATGDYTWHIFGKIEDTPADITMTSSPSTFVSVVKQSDVSFPAPQPSLSDLQAQVTSAQQAATTGTIAGAAGILIGLIGIGIALSRGKKA